MESVKQKAATVLPLETELTKSAAFVLRALNNGLRQKMIKFIHTQKRINVTELYRRLHIEQSVASQHLAILRKEGFVTGKRAGKEIYYSLNYERFANVDQLVKAIVQGALVKQANAI